MMGSTYDDTLFDFDINLLNSTTTTTVQDLQAKNERLRKALSIMKKKVLFSHTAITRYKSARSYANILENNQVFSKEGCKQHLIEIRNFIEKVNRLENACHIAENRDKEKNETIRDLQNKNEALQLQINQLNALLKEEKDKTEVTPVIIERSKERARKGLLQRENETLRKEINKIANLEKDNEALRKENAKILNLEKVINEILMKNSESEISVSELLNKILEKDDGKSCNAEGIYETLRKENSRIPNLEKENETLRKENAKIPYLEQSNEALSRENNNIQKLEKENETLRKQNAKIKNLEKEMETLREENSKKSNMAREIEKVLKELDLAKKEKSTLQLEYNELLQKYESLSDRNSRWCDNADNDIFEDVLPHIANNSVLGKKCQSTTKIIMAVESDNDYSNEIVSVDTGRGSSLASSDNEKCLHSPEYYLNDSPLNEDHIIELKKKAKVVSKATSPILFEESVETVTTPITVHIENQNLASEKTSIEEKYPKLLRTIEKTVSPITVPIEVASSPVIIEENISTDLQTQEKQDEECRDLNNSLQTENHNDCEVENILSSMQLNFSALSPIPRTPAGLNFSESTVGVNGSSDVNKILQQLEIIEKLERKLIVLRKSSNKNIKDFLCKTDSSLTSDNNYLTNHLDRESYHENIIINNNDNNQILHPENFEKLLHPVEDLAVSKNSKNEISDPELTQDNNLVYTWNQLPMETLFNSFQNNSSEPNQSNASQISPMLLGENSQEAVILNSVPEELTMDTTITEVIVSPISDVEIDKLPTKDNVKKVKRRTNSKLDKLKRTLEPKYKIKRETAPLVKSRLKSKRLGVIDKKVAVKETSASLNDKNVYEKAVKIMAEINSQQEKIVKSQPKVNRNPSPKSTNLDKHIDNNDDQISQTSPAKIVNHNIVSPKQAMNLEIHSVGSNDDPMSQNCAITTRNNRKNVMDIIENCTVVLKKYPLDPSTYKNFPGTRNEENQVPDEQTSRKRHRRSSNEPDIQCKRILRSSTAHLRLSTEDNTESSNNRKSIENPHDEGCKISDKQPVLNESKSVHNLQDQQSDQHDSNLISYVDLDIFSEDIETEKETLGTVEHTNPSSTSCHPKESILCCMIQKYGVETVRPYAKKIPDSTVNLICDKLEQGIARIIEVPCNETKNAMNSLVADLRKLNYKHFITGLIKYLTKPERKIELFGKILSPPAPAMTKAEQILLFVISHLKTHWPSVDIVDAVLSNIEYTLFRLNRTPEFEVIESASHFYAVLCRYFGARSRLRLFILDAMYCIQFKSVPLIKQCLDVWMHIIPLAHMGIAKSPLVTCLVYLLHFYKCNDDKFNRVQDIRNILSRKYFYEITDWNEKKILEMFKNSIMDLKEVPVERKMLRLALIILAKRYGPRWCQNNIIKNLLQPMIEKETSNNVREFCVSMIGPLMRPYPVDMKVHCEIAINQLTDILNNDPSPKMEEAAITSMMFLSRHNQYRINQTLLIRKIKNMSPELEKILRGYVRTKPLKIWKKNLSKMARS